MRKFIVSRAAEADLRGIARYTVKNWGSDRAVRYAKELQACFQMLADHPEAGRACDAISRGLRRHEQAKHVIFYRPTVTGIFVVRVLHQQMLPTRFRLEP